MAAALSWEEYRAKLRRGEQIAYELIPSGKPPKKETQPLILTKERLIADVDIAIQNAEYIKRRYARLMELTTELEQLRVELHNHVGTNRLDWGPKIIQMVAGSYGVKYYDVLSSGRKQRHVIVRMVAMYMVRKISGLSFPDIGRVFDRDHSTIINACQKIERESREKVEFRTMLAKLERTIIETLQQEKEECPTGPELMTSAS